MSLGLKPCPSHREHDAHTWTLIQPSPVFGTLRGNYDCAGVTAEAAADYKARRTADTLLREMIRRDAATRETFPDTPAEAAAAAATERAYQALIQHLDTTGLTGSYWDPRGETESEENR